MSTYDLIVLGSGPGGYVAAIRAAQLGLSVAIIERESLGGICLNWGCIPTKALLRSAEILHYMQHAKDYGLSADNVTADIAAVVKRSRGVAKQLNMGVTGLMKKNKISVHMGDGAITAPDKLTARSAVCACRRETHLDIPARNGAARNANQTARHWFGCDWHRICQFLQ
jgi:dihydrolipoamide dehydrogenase